MQKDTALKTFRDTVFKGTASRVETVWKAQAS
jgi:hypothetical protein